jgi:hypothetical protein
LRRSLPAGRQAEEVVWCLCQWKWTHRSISPRLKFLSLFF